MTPPPGLAVTSAEVTGHQDQVDFLLVEDGFFELALDDALEVPVEVDALDAFGDVCVALPLLPA